MEPLWPNSPFCLTTLVVVLTFCSLVALWSGPAWAVLTWEVMWLPRLYAVGRFLCSRRHIEKTSIHENDIFIVQFCFFELRVTEKESWKGAISNEHPPKTGHSKLSKCLLSGLSQETQGFQTRIHFGSNHPLHFFKGWFYRWSWLCNVGIVAWGWGGEEYILNNSWLIRNNHYVKTFFIFQSLSEYSE